MGQLHLTLTEREAEVILSALRVCTRVGKGPSELSELYEKVKLQSGAQPDAQTVKLMVSNAAADFAAFGPKGGAL